MVIKDDIIQLITKLVSPPAEKWENDPFETLLKQCPKEVFDKYVDSQPEEAIPSTSDDVRTVNADARIQYSQILGGLYLELADLLEKQRSTTDDEFQLVSVQDVGVIKSSFQFFLLTAIIPFLEPGVCLPASERSTFIKSWKLYDGDKAKCAERLDFAAKVIVALLKSNEHISTLFLPKYIDDIIGVHFQLNELKANKYETQLEEVISKCRTDVLFESLMQLSRGGKSPRTSSPIWLKGACGRVLSKILVSEGGLALMLQYYNVRAGDNWTDNLPMTKNVAWCLVAVPKIFSHPLKYHENISNQFFEIIWSQKTPEKNTVNLFKSYVDEVHVRFSHNANVTVFDKILNFWEILDKRIQEKSEIDMEIVEEFSMKDMRNLQILSQMQSSYDVNRIRRITNCMFACAPHIPYIKDILRGVLDGVSNLGFSLYHYAITPSRHPILKKSETSSKIQEVGETNGNEAPTEELWLRTSTNDDEGVAIRLGDVFFITQEVIGAARLRTIMEMLNVALEEFLRVSEKEREDDAARFVQLNGAKLFSTAHSHFVVTCCYDKISEYGAEKGFTSEEFVQLLKITENILNNATLKLIRLQTRKRSVDVFRMTDSEQREFESTRQTSRMCLSLVAMVYFYAQAGGRARDVTNITMKAVEAMANYVKASDAFPSSDPSYNKCIEEAKAFLRSLEIDIKTVTPPMLPMKHDRRRYNQMDMCSEWMDELHDDEPAIRGGTLMQISKAFHNKTYHCQKLLDYNIADTVKEMIIDDDSYVFLSAINCLCEMALFDRHQFDGIIEYYEELMAANNKEEKLVIRIGRIAEALGRLLIVRGESSIAYFDRFATVFMAGIKEPNELLRASSCGAFGNLLMATRGRGVEKWLEQLFRTLTNILRLDRSPLVRRSAADLVRHSLKAAGKDILVILREQLLDLHREVRHLYKTDRDEVVRLHAQLCCEEIDAALRQNQDDFERGHHRKIRF